MVAFQRNSELGGTVVPVDISIDSRFDLCDPNCIHGIWLATPCTTWSRARHGPVGSSWGLLRNQSNLFGIPGLCSHDRQKIQLGNRTMRFTARIIQLCHNFGIPCCFENPVGSMIWGVPPIRRVCNFIRLVLWLLIFVNMGPAGARGVQTWPCPEHPALQRCCHGHGGHCSRTGKFNVIDPVSKQLWTHLG